MLCMCIYLCACLSVRFNNLAYMYMYAYVYVLLWVCVSVLSCIVKLHVYCMCIHRLMFLNGCVFNTFVYVCLSVLACMNVRIKVYVCGCGCSCIACLNECFPKWMWVTVCTLPIHFLMHACMCENVCMCVCCCVYAYLCLFLCSCACVCVYSNVFVISVVYQFQNSLCVCPAECVPS